MRFEIRGENRIGITRDVVNVLTDFGLDIRAFEVTPHHIYANTPGLRDEVFPRLTQRLLQLPGVHDIKPLDRLPTERRREQLHATLAALGDPVIAVDADGMIAQANPGAHSIAGQPGVSLRNQPLSNILSEPGIKDLRHAGFRLPEREVVLGGQTYLLQVEPIGHVDDDTVVTSSPGTSAHGTGPDGETAQDAASWGGVLVFHRPARLGRVIAALQDKSQTDFDDIIGSSRIMARIKSQAIRLAAIDAPLLILGETGTGKELFARACHRSSTRANQPFLALNCAAMPESLAESELFGYVAGAFTNARRGGKPGLLELADGGTLFLDEIGELTPYLQAKLLRVLQDGRFRRVGGTDEITVDIRIISATNRDLEGMSHDGRFREDLFFRLNVLGITLPPLRERADDMAELAGFFIARTAQQTERPEPRLTADGLAWLSVREWKGNVRELENTLFRAVALLDGDTITARDLANAATGTGHDTDDDRPAQSAPAPKNITNHPASDSQSDPIADALVRPDLNSAMEMFERAVLARLYPDYPSSRKLAERLGVSHTAIANKLRKYGISG